MGARVEGEHVSPILGPLWYPFPVYSYTLLRVGDIHGCYPSLLKVLKKVGVPSSDNAVVFNGDFVDRGMHGIAPFKSPR